VEHSLTTSLTDAGQGRRLDDKLGGTKGVFQAAQYSDMPG